jgi:O-antigen ligase
MKTCKLKAISEKINYHAFLLLAFSLNFHQTIIKFTLGFWLITCVFSIDWNQKTTKKKYYIPIFLLSLLIIGRVIASLVHDDLLSLLTKLFDTQLALLLLPILIVRIVNKWFSLKQVLLSYIIGCLISCIIAVTYFYLYRYNILNGNVEGTPLGTNTHKLADDISLFQLFISPFFKHRAAMGVNISLSIASLIYLTKTSTNLSFLRIIAAFFILIIFSTVLYATGSRSGILSLIFILLTGTVYLFRRKRIIIIIFLFIGASIAGVLNLKTTRLIDRTSINNKNDVTKMDPRFQIWKSAIEIIKEHPSIGIGYSKVKSELYKKYKEHGQIGDIYAKNNSHNQFLQFSLESGIWSAIIFTLILLPIYFEKTIYYLSFSFSSTFFIYSMTEDTLIIINGVSIFVFFITLLILSQKQFSVNSR